MTPIEFKNMRLDKGYTQAGIALNFETTVTTVSRWETGQVKIPKWAIRDIKRLEPAPGY